MFCTQCGKKVPDGSRFCLYCGAKLPVIPEEPSEDTSSTQQTQTPVPEDTTVKETQVATVAQPEAQTVNCEEPQENTTPALLEEVATCDDLEYDDEDTAIQDIASELQNPAGSDHFKQYWNDADQVYAMPVAGYILPFSQGTIVYAKLAKAFDMFGEPGCAALTSFYQKSGDIETVLTAVYDHKMVLTVFQDALNFSLKLCSSKGIYTLTEDNLLATKAYAFNGRNYSVIDVWSACIQSVAETYKAIREQAQEERDYREYRKATRDRFVGGGFGISGALEGMAKAGAMNMATGAAHSIFNAIGNSQTNSTERSNLKKLYNDEDSLNSILQAYRIGLDALRDATATALSLPIISNDRSQDARDIIANVKAGKIPPAHRQEALLKALHLNPIDMNTYTAYLTHYADENLAVTHVAQLMGHGAELQEVKDNLLDDLLEECDDATQKRFNFIIHTIRDEQTYRIFHYYLMVGIDMLEDDLDQAEDWLNQIPSRRTYDIVQALQETQRQYEQLQEEKESGNIPTSIPAGWYMDVPNQLLRLPAQTTELQTLAISRCPNLTSLTIPPSVTTIQEYAIVRCPELTYLEIPATVQSCAINCITDGMVVLCGDTQITGKPSALNNCHVLWDIPQSGPAYDYFYKNNVMSFTTTFAKEDRNAVLQNIKKHEFREDYAPLYVPMKDRMNYGDSDKMYPGIVSVPHDRFTKVGPQAFYQANIVYMFLPGTVQDIGRQAFAYATVVSIWAQDGLQSIGIEAFAHCHQLKEVLVPDTLTQISSKAFADCPNLKTLSLLNPQLKIAQDAFENTNIIIECMPQSTVQAYCEAHQIPYWLHGSPNPYAAHLAQQEQRQQILAAHRSEILRSKTIYGRDAYAEDIHTVPNISDAIGKPPKGWFSSAKENDRIYTVLSQARANNDDDLNLLAMAICTNQSKPTCVSTDGQRNIEIHPWTMSLKDVIGEEAYTDSDIIYVDGQKNIDYISQHAFLHSKVLAFRGLGVQEIWEEAFLDSANLQILLFGNKLRRIENRAFAHCPNLTQIYLPPSVVELGEDIFQQTPVTVICDANSPIHQYCADFNIPYMLR